MKRKRILSGFMMGIMLLSAAVVLWVRAPEKIPFMIRRTDAPVTRFFYQHAGMSSDSFFWYDIVLLPDGGAEGIFSLNGGYTEYTLPVEKKDREQLENIVRTHDVFRWDGFDRADKRVRDGKSFTLKIAFADGHEIHAHGSNAFPRDYGRVMDEVKQLLEKYIRNGETAD